MRNKILLFLIIAIIVAGGVGYWLYQGNSYSKEVLKLEILGPQTASVGQEVEYTVRLKNNGNVRLDDPQLVFEYPKNTEPSGGRPLRVNINKDEIKAIYPGQEQIFSFKGRLFGEQGDLKEAKAMVSYRPKNLSARYVSKTSCLSTIGEVPLTFEFDVPSVSGTNQESNFSLNYFSSIDYPLSDLEIKIDYPNGFQFKQADPKGIADNEWRIPLLNKAEGGRISITGNLQGELGEIKIFKAKIGVWQNGEFVVLKQANKQVKIIEPSLYITETINNSSNYTANVGELLHYQIVFRNIGNAPLQNLFLASKLNGKLFDFATIHSIKGQSQRGDNSIIWDWHDVPKLQFLDAGDQGEVEFWVKVKENEENVSKAKLENEIILGQSRRKFITKINSKVELTQDAYTDDEIFGSQGNLPPSPGKDSFFTVIWRVKNYYNLLEDAEVRASLPEQVKLTGKVDPQKLSFDPKTREIVWSIGNMDSGTGIKDSFQLAFQIQLLPTSNQQNNFAQLVGPAVIQGLDQWTETQLQATSTAITTESFGEQGRVK